MKVLVLLPLLIINNFIFKNLYSQNAELVFKNISPLTLTIETDSKIGSGFIVGDNKVVTNYHVINSMKKGVCYHYNNTTKYEITGIYEIDEKNDLAIIHVSNLESNRKFKFFKKPINIGQKIFVISSPKGLSASITEGIVSGLREIDGVKLIQISAPISSGSSGGPILSETGELIGVTVSQIQDGQNINFGIPSFYVEYLLRDTSSLHKNLNDYIFPKQTNTVQKNSSLNSTDLYRLGIDSYDRGDYEKAIIYFEEYSSLVKDNYDVYFLIFKSRSKIDKDMTSGYATSDANYFITKVGTKWISYKKEITFASLYLANYYIKINDFRKAENNLKRAIIIDPGNREAISMMEIVENELKKRIYD